MFQDCRQKSTYKCDIPRTAASWYIFRAEYPHCYAQTMLVSSISAQTIVYFIFVHREGTYDHISTKRKYMLNERAFKARSSMMDDGYMYGARTLLWQRSRLQIVEFAYDCYGSSSSDRERRERTGKTLKAISKQSATLRSPGPIYSIVDANCVESYQFLR